MRSLLITVAAVIAAGALAGCRDKKPEPVPPPQSARLEHYDAPGNSDCPQAHRGVSEISWFQGTLEEAFARHASRHGSKPARPVIRY
jgi:hypothetical protein